MLCCARAAADAREAAATAASQGDMLAQGSALGSLRRAHMAALRVDSQSGPTVKKAFRELSLRVHPDKNVEADEALAKEAFQFLQAAHAALVMLANR